MWEAGEADSLACLLGGARMLLCSLPGAALRAWVACRFFGRQPLAMSAMSMAMLLFMSAASLHFAPDIETRLSAPFALWFSIAAGSSWLVTLLSLPHPARSLQAVALGLIATLPFALTQVLLPGLG